MEKKTNGNSKDKIERIMIKGARVMWARLLKPGRAFDEGDPDLFSVNFTPSNEDREKLLNAGATFKVHELSGEAIFVARRSTKNTRGEDVAAPAVVDAAKNKVTEAVGNGSVCNILITPFRWSKNGLTGTLLYLNAVQVIKHEPAGSDADAFAAIEEAAAANDDLQF